MTYEDIPHIMPGLWKYRLYHRGTGLLAMEMTDSTKKEILALLPATRAKVVNGVDIPVGVFLQKLGY